MRLRPAILSAALLLSFVCIPVGIAAGDEEVNRIWHPLTVERLPDLNTPRGSHRTVVFGDEIVVLGGHTDGFKPLETAEYYSKGEWHTVPMVYPHENGFAALLQDGRILLGGGSPGAFGIGQSWGAEIYDPSLHIFTSAGIMSAKRAMSSALTRPDGGVIIAGNWYADDSFETWSSEEGFVSGAPLSPGWAEPHILPASSDDIIVFGPWDTRGNSCGDRVDHLGGETEQVSLLEEWLPIANYHVFPENCQIADYTYLLSVKNRTSNETAILKVDSGEFSLLEMEEPLPVNGPDGTPIGWGPLQVDRPARLIWIQGLEPMSGSICIARIDYNATFDGGKASTTLFRADTPGGFPKGFARLLPGGRLFLAGGTSWNEGSFPVETDNFKTFASVYVFHTEASVAGESRIPAWPFFAVLLVIGGCIALILNRKKKAVPPMQPDSTDTPSEELVRKLNADMLQEIDRLIMDKELFKQQDLRVSDIASLLATNQTYVSILVNSMSGNNFASLIGGYRIRYAQELMRQHPDMPHADVAEAAGFSSRTAFLRTFKAQTGKSPTEWKKQEGLV